MEEERYWDDPEEFSDAPTQRRGMKAIALALAVTSLFTFVRTTMAGNVSLGSDKLEFGQGVAIQAACSGNTVLTLAPGSTFVNVSNAGSYKLASISLSNIPAGCNGKDFKIQAYDSQTTIALPLYDTTTSALWIHSDGGTFRGIFPGDGYSVTSTSGKFVATFTLPASLSSNTISFTVESSQFVPNYKVGDIGPGGGLIFYYNPTGTVINGHFVHYMEMAPNTWSGGSADPQKLWATASNQNSSVTNTDAFGAGYANTIAIVNQGNGVTTAAGAVRAYTANGKSDWFLPTGQEAVQWCKYMYGQAWVSDATGCTNTGTLNTGIPANFQAVSNAYWTSSQYSASQANEIYMGNTLVVTQNKSSSYYVRPIRAFYN